jgi:hypothetical protein
MNDNELDRLLDLWEAPPPRRSLRDGLQARFPRSDRRGFASPLRWALAILLASVALVVALAGAVAIAQSSYTLSDLPVVRTLNGLYQNFLEARQAGRAKSIVTRIAESEPQVFVDGRSVAPLEFGPAATMNVQIPGEGVYSITSYPVAERRTADGRPTGWVEAGHIHGKVIEFRAAGKQVRIECNKPIVDGDRPVFAIHRP